MHTRGIYRRQAVPRTLPSPHELPSPHKLLHHRRRHRRHRCDHHPHPSQVNPHVAPFYAYLQGRAGRPSGGRKTTGAWRGGFLLGAAEVALKEDMCAPWRACVRRERLRRALA